MSKVRAEKKEETVRKTSNKGKKRKITRVSARNYDWVQPSNSGWYKL
jgi:hypothetical protein